MVTDNQRRKLLFLDRILSFIRAYRLNLCLVICMGFESAPSSKLNQTEYCNDKCSQERSRTSKKNWVKALFPSHRLYRSSLLRPKISPIKELSKCFQQLKAFSKKGMCC